MMSDGTTNSSVPAPQGADTTASKKPWCSPMLQRVGRIGDVLQGGGGKLSPTIADSGDTRKPSGQA